MPPRLNNDSETLRFPHSVQRQGERWPGGGKMPPKKEDKGGGSAEEDPNKVLLKLHSKHGDSACFEDMADQRISAEQRLMELRLEQLDGECVELRNKRLEYWTAPAKQLSMSSVVLPEQHRHVDILELRKQRLAELAQVAKCAPAHPALHQHSALSSNMSTLLERVNTVKVLGPMLLEFCDQHADRVARQRCCYLRRVANLCKSSQALESVAPLLQARLALTEREFEVLMEGKEAMSHRLPIAIKDEETRLSEAGEGGPAKAPETRGTKAKEAAPPKPGVVLPGRTSAEAAAALTTPMTKEVMQVFLRWTTAHVRLQKRMTRLLAKLQWLPYSQRYELLRRAKDVAGPHAAVSSAPSSHASGGGAASAGSKMPTMVTGLDKLNVLLGTLRSHFGIEAEPEADNALAFAFEVKGLFNSLHAIQTADTTYPPYDTNLVGETIAVPAAGKSAGDARGRSKTAGGAAGGSGGKAALDTTFLKPCPWLADMSLEAQMDGAQRVAARQRAELAKNIKESELDHILVAEMGSLLEDDLDKVHARIDAQVKTHVERAMAPQDSQLGTGKAVTQPTAASAAHTQVLGAPGSQLPADRLGALYQMRLLQTRQARRRLLGVLNYFVSLKRRLALDSQGMAFPVAAGALPDDASGAAGNDSVASAGNVSTSGGGAALVGGNGANRQKHELHVRATEYESDPAKVMTFQAIEVRDDSYDVDAEDIVRVRDAFGKLIMYEEALKDEEALRHEMCLIGTHFLGKFTDKGVADRVAVLEDLWQSEAAYYENLKRILDVHAESYEHCCDKEAQQRLAQTMMNLMARRPVLDLNMAYLSDCYSTEVVAVQMEASLMRELLSSQQMSERLYRNTIAVRNDKIPEPERVGFPGPVYAPGTHDELQAGVPMYYPTPGGIGVGVLDVYSSLDSLAAVGHVLDSILQELIWVHRLQPGVMVTALKTVVLQQALIEFRLLLEEEDLTEELSKKAADEISRRPYANNFLVDDPFAMDRVIDDVKSFFEYEAESQQKTVQVKGAAAKTKGAGGKAKDEEVPVGLRLLNEASHPNAMMQAHMNAIEAVLLRRRLLEAIYESQVVELAYRAQATAYKREISATSWTPIAFIHASDVETSGRQKNVPMEEVSSLGADFSTRLAVLEFDLQFAGFDFQTAQGLKETLQEKNMFLRKAVRMQVLERGMLAIALEYNQPALDRCMASVIIKEDNLLGQAGARSFSTAGGKKKAEAHDAAERHAKIAAEVKKLHMEEANRITDYFLDLSNLKRSRRESILDTFNQRSAAVKAGKTAKDEIKGLKCQLLDLYCEQLLGEMDVYSVKAMIARSAEMLVRQAEALPKPKLLFTQNLDPQASILTQARALEEADESGRDTSIFATDLALINLWRLPHPLEVMEELPKEPRVLTCYLDSLWALHSTMRVLVAYASVIPKPLIMTKDRLVGMDYVQAEMGKVRHMVENLKDKTAAPDVASLLSSNYSTTHAKYVLSLQGVVYQLLSADAPASQIQLVRSCAHEAIAPLFPPAASFPVALPESAATQAVLFKTVRKGPLLHAPVPVPYVDMGHRLFSAGETARALLKSEWVKLEALLSEALSSKGISAGHDPLLAATSSAAMMLKSRELDQLRAHLCALHSGISRPRSLAEYKEWVKIYENEVVARMLKAKEKADRDYSQYAGAELAGDTQSAASSRVAEKAAADYQALQGELAQRAYMVKTIHDLCCKMFLERQTEGALASHAAALHAVDMLAIDPPAHGSASRSALHQSALAVAAKEARSKEPIVLEFLHGLRQAAREDTDANTGVAVLVIPKYQLAELLDVFAGKLRDWGQLRTEEALRGMRQQVANLTHLLYLQERNMQYTEAVREREHQSMARRIDVAVKDNCFALLFRMDEVQRKLEDSQAAMAEMERSVRERLKVEFEDLVKDLQQQLTLVRAQFTEYREQLQQDMKSNLQEIKKEAMMKVVKSSSAPIELKRMTLKMAHTEDTIEDLTIENSELKRALLKVAFRSSSSMLMLTLSPPRLHFQWRRPTCTHAACVVFAGTNDEFDQGYEHQEGLRQEVAQDGSREACIAHLADAGQGRQDQEDGCTRAAPAGHQHGSCWRGVRARQA